MSIGLAGCGTNSSEPKTTETEQLETELEVVNTEETEEPTETEVNLETEFIEETETEVVETEQTETSAGLIKQEEGGSSLTDEEWAEYDAKFEELLNESTESEGNDGSGNLYFENNPDLPKDQSQVDFG